VKEPKQFYAYLWLRKDGTPYYVGKGSGNRAYSSKRHKIPCPKDRSRIIVFPMLSEAEAFECEKTLIKLFGRKDRESDGMLRNLTDGGEGCAGVKGPKSPEHRKKIGIALTGRRASQETRDKISAAKKGRYSEAQRLAHTSPEYRAKLSAILQGRPVSNDAKQKMSVSGKKRVHPPQTAETKRKISESGKKAWAEGRARGYSGKKHSPETLAKLASRPRDAEGHFQRVSIL
jgi:NUMOD3 motif